MRRRFFFFESSAKASSLNAGAMMTSLKISAMSCAVATSSGRFTTMMPPNGAWRSVA
jgi:hypothetical protein